MECGGKRSATPVWLLLSDELQFVVALLLLKLSDKLKFVGQKAPSPLSLCRRTPNLNSEI